MTDKLYDDTGEDDMPAPGMPETPADKLRQIQENEKSATQSKSPGNLDCGKHACQPLPYGGR